MEYLPLFINFQNKSILVVGGGSVAFRKIQLLKKTGAIIKIVADKLCPELRKILSIKTIIWIGKIFTLSMLDNIYLIIVATNDVKLNDMVFHYAITRCVLINTVDDQSKCSCIFPAIINRNPILIGISSCGKAPVLIRILKERLELLLTNALGVMAEIAGQWRSRVKEHITNLQCRRNFWEKLFYNSNFSMLIEKGNFKKAHQVIQNFIYTNNFNNKKRGTIILVGAGPGDVGLLTIRGLQAIQRADVILYDHLVNLEILDLARKDSNKIYVGKCFKNHSISQKKLNKLMIELAQCGNDVVRLKGGDSFIFGRGGEELQAISNSDIMFQVIPGITAGIGAAAYAGIPLTHREYAHSVTFITGHRNRNEKINWGMLSDHYQTVVVYMGKNNAINISKNLISIGRHKETPVAIISQCTLQNQKVLIGTLVELDRLVIMVDQPLLLIIGYVVLLYNKTCWFNNDHNLSGIIKLI